MCLLGHSRERLALELAEIVDRPFRVDQIFRALHERRVRSFDEMTDLSLELRSALGERYTVERPSVVEQARSTDGTVKYVFGLEDGATIEAVDIPEARRRTVCVSSQAGCALACRFCVTGYWGAGRSLDAAEIVGQVLAVSESGDIDWDQLNLVMMGMGEPLLNLEAVKEALGCLCVRLPWRRVTLSTAGVIPGIEDMATWEMRPNLAVSLHAPDDERRTQLMPINRRYPLADLLDVLEHYPRSRSRSLTFEYTLIAGFNDSLSDADSLARIARRLPGTKINLIPQNPDPVLGPEMKPPPWSHCLAFSQRLVDRGIPASVRRPRGDDIGAACGQLRAPHRDPRGYGAPLALGSSTS